MYAINLNSRETGKTEVENYATGFTTYAEASSFRDRYEMEFRACGWYGVVTILE